jgi:hypothetical protein
MEEEVEVDHNMYVENEIKEHLPTFYKNNETGEKHSWVTMSTQQDVGYALFDRRGRNLLVGLGIFLYVLHGKRCPGLPASSRPPH